MKGIYNNILNSITIDNKQLAILIDPDKFSLKNTEKFIKKVNDSFATHIFIGGSEVDMDATEALVNNIKKYTELPIVLFPGDITQITNEADGLLYLSLISGRNSDYLIDKHVQSVSKLRNSNLEIIPTGYILIENGKQTAVQRVTKTKPISRDKIQLIADTAKAGEFLGMKLVYLEAGSGAINPVNIEIIELVKNSIRIPLIVGGGIRNKKQIKEAYSAGADLIVIGTAFEDDELFFEEIRK